MKNIKLEEMNAYERKEIAELFATWLRPYVHEVIVQVLERRDEIVNNEATMHLLRELHAREVKENADFASSINFMLGSFDTFSQHDPHNHAFSHSRSYRDVLYDMYIK